MWESVGLARGVGFYGHPSLVLSSFILILLLMPLLSFCSSLPSLTADYAAADFVAMARMMAIVVKMWVTMTSDVMRIS